MILPDDFKALKKIMESRDEAALVRLTGFLCRKAYDMREQQNPYKPKTWRGKAWLEGWELADFEMRAVEIFEWMDREEHTNVH